MALLDYVDKQDKIIGTTTYDKIIAKKLIHRIARVFLFDDQGQIYVQRRSLHLQSAPGLWDQSAAGHVDAGEDYVQAAVRELYEELGLQNLPLKFCLKYYDNEAHHKYGYLSRFNSLFIGNYDGSTITVDPGEVMDGKWLTTTKLEAWMEKSPQDFAEAFIVVYRRYKKWLKEHTGSRVDIIV